MKSGKKRKYPMTGYNPSWYLIFKNKGNIHEFGRGIKLLSQIMKCFERILDIRMRETVEPYLVEEQFGFRKRKATTELCSL